MITGWTPRMAGGGGGGGGGGGPAIGVLCGNAATPSVSDNSYVLGAPGQGGVSSGYAGAVGLAADVSGCL